MVTVTLQLDVCPATFLHKMIASEDSLRHLSLLTARRKLDILAQFDNVVMPVS